MPKKVPTLEQILEDPESVKLSTAPWDPRFPNANQTKNCWQNYVDYHTCVAAKGDEFEPCKYFRRIYKIMCPANWVEQWEESRMEGKLAADLSPPSAERLGKMTGQ